MGFLRSWLIRGLILAALAGVVAAGWVAHDWVSPEKVREAVVAALRDKFPDADVHVGAAQLRIFGGICVTDLRLTRKGESEPFFVAPSAVLSHDKELLNRGELAIRKVELDGPTVRLDRRADGTWNVSGLTSSGPADQSVPTFVVKNATLLLTDHRPGGLPPIALTGAKLNVLNDPVTVLKIEAQGTVVPAPDGQAATGGLAVPVSVTAKFNRTTSGVQARVEVPDLAVGPDLAPALAKLHPALGDYATQFTARVGVKADLTVPGPGQSVKYDVRLDVRDGRWEDADFPWAVEHLTAAVRVQDGRVTVEKGTARLGKAAAEFALETRCLTESAGPGPAVAAAAGPVVQAAFVQPTSPVARPSPPVPLRDDDPFRVLEEKLERLDLTIRELALDDDFFHRLPPAARAKLDAIRRMFSPAGGVDLTVRFARAGAGWKREVDLRPNRLAISYELFRYPVQDLAGWVKKVTESDGTDEYRVQLTGSAGGRRVELGGRVGGSGLDPLIDLKIAGTDVPIDDRIFTALPPPYNAALLKLRATARGDFVVEVRQPEGVNRCESTFRVQVYDGALNYALFPYPLTRVKGYVTVQVVGTNSDRPVRPGEPPAPQPDADTVTLRDFEAYHAGGRLIVVEGKTEAVPRSLDRKVVVKLQGENLPIDDDLRAAVNGLKLGGVLRTFNPRGRVTFGADVELIDRKALPGTAAVPAAQPVAREGVASQPISSPNSTAQAAGTAAVPGGVTPAAASLPGDPAFDPAADLRLALNFYGPSVTPSFFAYDLDDLSGVVRYAGGKVELADFKARHGRSALTLDAAEVRFGGDGAVWANLGKATVAPFVLDADLVTALPPKLRSGVQELRLTGPMDLTVKHLVVQGPPDRPPPPQPLPRPTAHGQAPADPDAIVFWSAELRMAGASFDTGLDWKDAHGSLASVGRYEGTYLGAVVGNAWFDRATVANHPVTAAKVSFRVRPQQPDPGRPGGFTPPAIEFPDLTANLFQGTLGGEARVVLDEQTRYRVWLTAAGVRLDELATHCHLGSGAELRGLAQGKVLIENLPDPKTGRLVAHGSGQVDVPNGRMLNLPFLLPLLKLLKLQAPDQTAFEEAHAVFEVRGDRVKVSQLDLIGTAVSLGGSGELDTAGDDVRLEFYTIWSQAMRKWLTTPLGDLTSFMSGNLFKIEVVRKNGDTTYTPHMLPGVTEPFRAAAERMRARLGRPPEPPGPRATPPR